MTLNGNIRNINQLKATISPSVKNMLKHYSTATIEHRFDGEEGLHYLLLDGLTFDEKLYKHIKNVIDAFVKEEGIGTICILPKEDDELVLLRDIPVIGSYNINTKFPEQEKSTSSNSNLKPISNNNRRRLFIGFGLGAVAASLLLIVLYLLFLVPKPDRLEANPPSEQVPTEEEEPNDNQLPTTDQEQIFAKIEELEKQIEEKDKVIQEKETEISDVTLALERKDPNSNLSAIIPATIVRASDLSEGMVLSGGHGERITISDLDINGLVVDFKYQRNGQSQSGKIILDFEMVQLNGLGTGQLFNSEQGKVVMNILQPNGKVIVLREE